MQPDPVLIRQLEEISINAWPALETLLYDGWVLRFANGYTRRSNSVNPLYPSSKDIDEKISTCELLYQGKQLNTAFKMTAQSTPPGLDAILEARGYQAQAHTSLQVLDLAARDGTAAGDASLSEEVTEAWLAGYTRMSKSTSEQQTAHARLLHAILPEKRFASITVDGKVIACGLAVLQDGQIGLFEIATDPELRRQGHAQRLIETLLEWGKSRGAQRSYLQVMADNPPALALYAKLGYREAYQYWYRVKHQISR